MKPKKDTRVVPLCPGCGWLGEAVAKVPKGWPPKCGALCGCAFACDWLKVEAVPQVLARTRVERARLARAEGCLEAAVKRLGLA